MNAHQRRKKRRGHATRPAIMAKLRRQFCRMMQIPMSILFHGCNEAGVPSLEALIAQAEGGLFAGPVMANAGAASSSNTWLNKTPEEILADVNTALTKVGLNAYNTYGVELPRKFKENAEL